ncbi:MAG: DNA polymerase I [Acutalibacteraceae bacterium]
MKYLVLDGNSILNRAFYGIKMLSNKKGQMTNGIYGFLSTLQKLLSEVSPDAVAVAFDLPKPTFRHKMYDGYKASRKGMPEELASQFPILKEILISMGYKLITCEGYEADDILGTFAKYCEDKGYECTLATGDRDCLQLVSDNVFVRIAKTKFGKAESVLYDKEKIKEDYGVTPTQLIDIKALQGDASDCIPGVKGVGEKTAKSLIEKYESIENIYNNIENLDIKPNLKSKLISDKEKAYLSYDLGKIEKNVPIEITDNEFIPAEMDNDKIKKIFTELEFYKFMDKFGISQSSDSQKMNLDFSQNYDEILKNIEKFGEISIFIEQQSSLIERCCIGIGGDNYYYFRNIDTEFKKFLKKICENQSVKKNTFNLKKLYRILMPLKINLFSDVFDILLAAYILNPEVKENIVSMAASNEISPPLLPEEVKSEEIKCIETCYYIEKLKNLYKIKITENNQEHLLTKIEQPISKVLADMELTGFFLDKNGLEDYGKELSSQLQVAEEEIYRLAGEKFNINSPKQLGTILFEKLNLPKGKKLKTGYSTGAQILEKLRGYHPIINMILEYRALAKLKSTYVDSMVNLVTSRGRIHTSFNQTETRTGRISSAEPNLQNIPVRTERGRKLRKYFKSSEGKVLIDADYSQIELRVMAHISHDKNMTEAFKNREDIHAITASQIFGVPVSMVTPEMRARSKTVNFGILYGMSAFSLAQDLKISRFDAQNYINKYLEHYSGIDNYMNEVILFAKEQGYVETIFHRRRYLPELNSSNFSLRSFGERVARNMPIQGSAADIIKIAMVNVYERLIRENFESKIILQVHDELIIESPENEFEEVKKLLKEEMENAVKLSVPLEVHIAVGKTWFDAKE